MEVTIAGGAVIDIATRHDLDEHRRRIEALFPPPKRFRFERRQGNSAARATPVLVDVGSPPQGEKWRLQWALLSGDDPIGATVANVTAGLFIGTLPQTAGLALGPPTSGLDPLQCVLTGGNSGLGVPTLTGVPDVTEARPGQNVYGIFTGTGLLAGAKIYRVVIGVLIGPDGPQVEV